MLCHSDGKFFSPDSKQKPTQGPFGDNVVVHPSRAEESRQFWTQVVLNFVEEDGDSFPRIGEVSLSHPVTQSVKSCPMRPSKDKPTHQTRK